MIITHRSGNLEEMPSSMLVKLASVSGVPIAEKAVVTEDYLVEIAGSSRLWNANSTYDALRTPR